MTTSFRVVLALLGVSLLALAITGSPIYSRLSYLWGILLIGGWIWSRLALYGIRFTRWARSRRAQMGQIFEERFDIENTSRLPRLWLEIRDLSPLPNTTGSQVLALLGGRQRRSYLSRTRLMRRGVFPLGPTRMVSGDPFGLFRITQTFPAYETLLVYPYMVEVRVFPNPPGVLSGGEAVRQRTPQATSNAAGVREYAPGDPLNRIHWLSTARRERLMVKEFELDPQSEVWLFLDAQREVQAARPFAPPSSAANLLWSAQEQVQLPPATEEYVVSIAASVARFFVRRDRAVGMVFNGGTLNILPPDKGARQLNKMLEALALLRAEGQMRFSALVTAQARYLTRGSTVVLITPSMREQVVLTVEYLRRRGLRAIALLVDAGSFGGPKGAERLEASIRGLGVPVRRVVNGEDLEAALNHVGI